MIRPLLNLLIRRWLQGCLLLLSGCKVPPSSTSDDTIFLNRAADSIRSCMSVIRTGDLITRTGNDFTSESLRQLNRRDQTYSHCGIASIENDSVFVYHAMGGEFNPDQALLRESFSAFASPQFNRGFGIFRFQLPADAVRQVRATVQLFHRARIPFDMDFDLATNDRFYCAEFVTKAYRAGTAGRLSFDTSQLGGRYFAGVDDCFLQPTCQLIKRVRYSQ
jgi:hypothetical protein